MSRVSPSGSPTKWIATRSPWPASTWRSTALTQALSSPSTNHFANGGVAPVERLGEGRAPREVVAGLLGPERLAVGRGRLVQLGRAVRLRPRTRRTGGKVWLSWWGFWSVSSLTVSTFRIGDGAGSGRRGLLTWSGPMIGCCRPTQTHGSSPIKARVSGLVGYRPVVPPNGPVAPTSGRLAARSAGIRRGVGDRTRRVTRPYLPHRRGSHALSSRCGPRIRCAEPSTCRTRWAVLGEQAM